MDYIYPDEYVHNMDVAVITSAGSLLLGVIEVINPTALLLGTLLPLTIYAVNCYIGREVGQKLSLQEALQNRDVVKEARYYYEVKRKELMDLHRELLVLKQKLQNFVGFQRKNITSFSLELLSSFDYKPYRVLLLPHLSVEFAYSIAEKEKLLLLREAELQKLETEIIDIAVMLGFHVNELIERKNNALEQLKTIEKQIDGVVNIWNQNLYHLSCEIALDHYKKHFLWQEALYNFELVVYELTLLQKFYEHQKSCFFVSKTSNVLLVLSEQVFIDNKYLNVVKGNKNILVSNIVITEHFLREHGLLPVELINCYRSEAKKMIADKELKDLALAKKKKKSIEGVQKKLEQKNNSGGGNGPDKDPNDQDPLPENNRSIMMHIFKNEEGHLIDTPENRNLLRNLVRDVKNYIGKDNAFRNDWYAKITKEGALLWARVRNNKIVSGGLNKIPEIWSPETGFCSPVIPKR